jgi:dTDP-4-amino-4,6-dideoxygalactose transaminase
MATMPDVGAGPYVPHVLEDIPLTRPSVPDQAVVAAGFSGVLSSGVLTNGPQVRELERRAAEYLGVRHCVAVSSCTAGLMLVLRALDLSGDVIVPSFTFAATAHAVAWNGLRPVFADVDPETLTLSPASVSSAIGVRTSAILATHVYGTPCHTDALVRIARTNGLRLVFDAAHAFGSMRRGQRIGGFGDAEVFSLSPTKVMIAGEGGLIATNDATLAERCRIGRDYGNPGDYDCQFVGLNARMSEFHAVLALASLDGLDERILRRNRLAEVYAKVLADVPGISFPSVSDRDRSTFKDLTILVDADAFGIDADGLASALAALGIETRRYYSPPVHRMRAYRTATNGHVDLSTTEWVSRDVLSLPMWSEMPEDGPARVAGAIRRIRARLEARAPRDPAPTDVGSGVQ